MTKEETADELTHLFDEYVWDVYGFIAYRLGNQADAEDLTQLTFERALKAWKSFDPERARAKTWLLAIARNLVIDHYRRDRSSLQSPIGEDGVAESDLPAAAGPGEVGLPTPLAEAINRLSPREREVLALRFGSDLRGPEIADQLELTVANVQQILSRTLRKLRKALEEPTPTSPG